MMPSASPSSDLQQDRRDTMWVAGVAAFVGSVVLNHFLPTRHFGLTRIVLMSVGGGVVLYFVLRPWAPQVAEWSRRRRGNAKPPGGA